MGIKTVPQPPYSPDLGPCHFWLFPKLRGRRYETIEETKGAVTKVIDTLTQEAHSWGLPEVVGTVEQVHCSWRRLLRKGLEFHVCTINKSAHTKKSGNLSYVPLIVWHNPCICINEPVTLGQCGLEGREFASGPGDLSSIPGRAKNFLSGTWYLLS